MKSLVSKYQLCLWLLLSISLPLSASEPWEDCESALIALSDPWDRSLGRIESEVMALYDLPLNQFTHPNLTQIAHELGLESGLPEPPASLEKNALLLLGRLVVLEDPHKGYPGGTVAGKIIAVNGNQEGEDINLSISLVHAIREENGLPQVSLYQITDINALYTQVSPEAQFASRKLLDIEKEQLEEVPELNYIDGDELFPNAPIHLSLVLEPQYYSQSVALEFSLFESNLTRLGWAVARQASILDSENLTGKLVAYFNTIETEFGEEKGLTRSYSVSGKVLSSQRFDYGTEVGYELIVLNKEGFLDKIKVLYIENLFVKS